jgi:hypothetical protein
MTGHLIAWQEAMLSTSDLRSPSEHRQDAECSREDGKLETRRHE